MTDHSINVAGIEIPSSDPVFLAVVGMHVLLGLVCTITGIIAMLSVKRGRHPSFGSIYFWCLGGVFVTAAGAVGIPLIIRALLRHPLARMPHLPRSP